MIYGLYISASGAAVNMARMDVYSNNLSNVSTVGFKPDYLAVRQRDVVRKEDNLPFADSNALLERLGAGVQPMPTRVQHEQGVFEETGNQLDLALRGDGFFAVRRGDGPDGIHLTRDGRFTLDADGRLVTVTEGAAVLDDGDGEIELDVTLPVNIRADGLITQNGEEVAQLAVLTVPNADRLIKAGAGALRGENGEVSRARRADADVLQGSVEQSATDAVRALMGATSAARGAQGNLGIMGMFNEIMDRAVNTLGRVS